MSSTRRPTSGRIARGVVALGLLLLSGSAGCREQARSEPTEAAGISADEQALWAYQTRVEGADQLRLLRFAVCRAEDKPAETLTLTRPLKIPAVSGDLKHAVVRGASLHIIYADGSHRSYHPDGMSPELNLPKSAVPLALAADAVRDTLVALVPAGVAAELPDPSAEAAATQPAEGIDGSEPAEPVEAIAASPPATAFGILTYDNGRWLRQRDAPALLDRRRPCWLAARNGAGHLLVATRASDSLVYLRTDGSGWSAPVNVPGIGPREVLAFEATFEAALLVVRDGGAARLLHLSRDGIERDVMLAGTTGAIDAGLFDSQIAVGLLDGENTLRVGLWAVEGGSALIEPADVAALEPKPTSWVLVELPIVAYVVLAGLLGLVFVRRRDSMATPAALPESLAPASYFRRGLAFSVDLAFLLPVLILLRGMLLPDAALEDMAAGERELTQKLWGVEIVTARLVIAGLFTVYAMVFEVSGGATPGKRLLRCRVADEQGRRCRTSAILMRNLLRFVEMFPAFDLLPTIVLIVLTRNRQRLGDLIARTLVVERVEVRPAADDQMNRMP